MDIITRLKQYMTLNGITSSQFADASGIPRPTLSQLLNGRNKSSEGVKKVSSEIISKIHQAYPSLNVLWLLFGDGDMETEPNIKFSEPEIKHNHTTSAPQSTDNQEIQHQIVFEEQFNDFSSEKSNIGIRPDVIYDINVKPESNNQSTPTPIQTVAEIPPVSLTPDKSKKVQSIMVFYNDNSFEIFKPVKS